MVKRQVWLLLIIAVLVVKYSSAQNYVELLRNGVLGQMYVEQGKYDSAEKYLVKALSLMPDRTRFVGYFSLVKIADAHHDDKKISAYLKELSCVGPKDTIYSFLNEYLESPMDRARFDALYKPKCVLKEHKKAAAHPVTVDSIIASLRDRDQAVRRKVNNNKERAEEVFKALEKEMHEVDSTNFKVLYDCIRRYGFPDLDWPLEGSRITLIIHTDNYNNFKKIDKYLLKAVKEGRLSPTDYAYALDRSLVSSGLKPKYYWLIPGTSFEEKNKPTDVVKVNKDRSLIGLPPYPMWTGWGFHY